MKKNYILVTGCAGFIGFHLCAKFLKQKNSYVLGVDNLNKNYDLSLKKNRLKLLKTNKKFFFLKNNIDNYDKLSKSLQKYSFKYIFHLAAQAGVENQLKNLINIFKTI